VSFGAQKTSSAPVRRDLDGMPDDAAFSSALGRSEYLGWFRIASGFVRPGAGPASSNLNEGCCVSIYGDWKRVIPDCRRESPNQGGKGTLVTVGGPVYSAAKPTRANRRPDRRTPTSHGSHHNWWLPCSFVFHPATHLALLPPDWACCSFLSRRISPGSPRCFD
jgi:hypothetical protein